MKKYIVANQYMRPASGIKGQSKKVANEIAKDLNKCAKDKKCRLHRFHKKYEYNVYQLIK